MTQKSDDKNDDTFHGNEWSELLKTGFIAIIIALLVRTLLFEPFNIPSGSMKPGLQIGDYLFVTKYSYGYSQYSAPLGLLPVQDRIFAKKPRRGDVIVFKLPTDTRVNYIKRLIGFPGDTVQVKRGELYLNGQKVKRTKTGTTVEEKNFNPFVRGEIALTEYRQTLPNGASFKIFEESDRGPLDNTEVYTVPKGHYFLMGDNRDNSQDSRVGELVGYVPFENFVGRAERIFFSIPQSVRIWEMWKWPANIRYDRIFKRISPE